MVAVAAAARLRVIRDVLAAPEVRAIDSRIPGECERDADAIVERGGRVKPHDPEADVGDTPAAVDEAVGNSVDLLHISSTRKFIWLFR